MIVGRPRARVPVLGEFEIGWRLLGEHEFVAVTGSNGKTTTVELIGHLHAEAGLAGRGRRQRRHGAHGLPGTLAPGATIVGEASSFQLEDTEAFAPEAAVLLNLAEDHLDRHGTFEAYRAAKLSCSPASRTRPSRSPRSGSGSRTSAAVRGGSASAPARAPSSPTAPGSCGGTSSRCSRSPSSACAAPHNVENAMAAAAVCLARGVEPDAVRAGLHYVPRRRRTGSRRSPRSAACSTSTTPRPPTSPRRSSGSTRSPAGCTRSSAAAARAAATGRSRPRVAERCRAAYLIGETAAELRERARAGRRPAARLRRPRARRAGRRGRRRARATSCCSRPPARRTTSTRASSSAATTSGRSCPLR